jgi:apolipoprotein N-acyltransferase
LRGVSAFARSLPSKILAAAVGGGVASLAFPPAGVWPLAFVAVVPLLWAIRDARPVVGALLGAVWGLAAYGATLYWIARFGGNAWWALTLLCAAFTALFGAFAPALLRRRRWWSGALIAASWWVAIEWLRGAWPLGGFTWGTLGVSQADDRVLLPLAAVAGVWGISFVIVVVNACLLHAATVCRTRARDAVAPLGLSAVLVVTPVVLGFPEATGEVLDVAVVQVDWRVPPGTSAVEADLLVAARYLQAHRAIGERDREERPDLIVWGEGALDPAAASSSAVMDAVRRTVASTGVPTVIGAVLDDPDGTEHTSTIAFDGQGAPAGRYDKVHLVPFGEYVPFRSRLGFIDALTQIPVDRVPGDAIAVFRPDGVPPFATPICFENAFPQIPRAAVGEGAAFLVVPVNNVAYGFTAASEQHLQMSRIRAVETGRWVIDAAASGVSAFVDPTGAVVRRTALFTDAILEGRIASATTRTWYVRVGDIVPLAGILIVMGASLRPRRRPGSRPAPAPLLGAPRTLVILPTYQERATIEEVVRRVLAAPQRVDVLVIDDGSPDGTGEAVRAIAAAEPRVRLRSRPAKSGLASAYLEGFRVALDEGYDLIVEMDSDLSHDPDELPALLEAAGRHDMALGSRYVDGGSVSNWSRMRVALSRAGNTYARIMLGVPVHDATSGYRVYRRATLEAIVDQPISSDGYGFQIELVMRADQLGFDLGEVPITFREREHGHSKLSRTIVVEALWLVTRWGIGMRVGREPLAEVTAP